VTVATPYGSWDSPLSAATIAAGGVGVGAASARRAGDGSTEVWWTEARPSEAGRVVLVRQLADGTTFDVLDAPWSVRTRVHEYGGGSWFHGPDHVYFSSWSDQRIYRVHADTAGRGAEPEPVTPEPDEHHGWRFADGRATPDGDWIVCVSEDHHGAVVAEHGEAVNAIVAIPATGGDPIVLSDRTDFVAAPRVSPDGRWMSWYCWDHPDMPWDRTRLLAAPVWLSADELRLGNVKVVADADDESIHGADWLADGRLVFSSDRNGFWNLYSWTPGDDGDQALSELVGSEIGGPAWVFGTQQWTELDGGRIVAVTTTDAADDLVEVLPAGEVRAIDTPFAGIGSLSALGTQILVVGAHADAMPEIAAVDPDSGEVCTVRPSDDVGLPTDWVSRAQAISFPVAGRTSHAFFYPPTSPDEEGEPGTLPPLVVMGHGGPTAHTDPTFNLKIQFWTTRGFAVVDVNYGGSSGFGRAYRQLLNGQWGVVDVEDCIAAAKFLADQGLVDRARMAIRGGSAGGFTVLSALALSDVFGAGTSLYGVADLEALATDTHKFESRYLDNMIGPWPEAKSIYDERSPINHTDGFSCPILVLQGDEDEVVPPSQSEAIVAALAAKGIPHGYILFEGEQHGFRQAPNIIRSLEAELWFYGKVFGFEPADAIEPVPGRMAE
jgi:dipeptidyl aminopeptidase/acylaminoacyl peptidase